ncbi:MAG: hypothetical protein WBA88_07810 [Pseudaminobacter sp.]
MFVKDVEHLSDELAAGILAHILGDGDELDTNLAQLADIELRVQRIAAEAAERVDHQIVEGMAVTFGLVDHVLKDRAILIQGRGPRLGEYIRHRPAVPLAIGAALRNLIRQRQIMLGLPCRGNTNIDGGIDGHGCLDCLLITIDDGVDFSGKEGTQQRNLVRGDGKFIGHIRDGRIPITGLTGASPARRTHTDRELRIDLALLVRDMSITVFHLQLSTARNPKQPEGRLISGLRMQPSAQKPSIRRVSPIFQSSFSLNGLRRQSATAGATGLTTSKAEQIEAIDVRSCIPIRCQASGCLKFAINCTFFYNALLTILACLGMLNLGMRTIIVSVSIS